MPGILVAGSLNADLVVRAPRFPQPGETLSGENLQVIPGGVSMGKTFADFYNYQKKPANIRVALGVRPREFIELFLERMERLALSIQA